jgi:hypothetical protein
MQTNTSKNMRNDQYFMRNLFPTQGKWNIPVIRKQFINLDDISLISCSDIKLNDSDENKQKGVHHFVDDYRFNGIYNNPSRTLNKYSQYRFLLSPDFSLYSDMNMWHQIENVAKNRWCGAYWQSKGLTVIPSVSWSTIGSFDFCFDGIERGSIVAVGMIGCKKNKYGFLQGYKTMLQKIQPEAVLCLGTSFQEMQGNLIPINYVKTRKVAC